MALTENWDGILVAYKVAARTVIYKGALVCLNAAGYAVPAADEASLTFVGVAYERGDNAAGDDGDVSARIWKDGSFRVAMDSPQLVDLGKTAYIVDDNTVTTKPNYGGWCMSAGYIYEICGEDAVRVCINRAVR